MAATYATLINQIEMWLQDSTNAEYIAATELNDRLQDALRDGAWYVPHIIKVPYEVESRTGTASATSAGYLVDTTETQFIVATDIGKVIHNTGDNTWAVVVTDGSNSTSKLKLSRDIMVSGEAYEMYNKDCSSNKQINIADVEDYLWVDSVEFPIGTRRKVDSINGNILTIGIDDTPDDTKDADANKIVHVYFAKRQKVSQLTTLVGAVDLGAGYSEGDTSMVIDGLTNDDVIEEDQEFTVAGMSEIYTVTAAVTVTSAEAIVVFYPGLEADVADDAVVTFTLSTLNRRLERVLVRYAAALASRSKSTKFTDYISKGGQGTWSRFLQWGQNELGLAIRDLESMAQPAPAESLSRKL